MIFFTADQHFWHGGIVEYDNRPFVDAVEMNEEMIRRWNVVVTRKDTVYIIGDFCWRGANAAMLLLNQLHGKKHLILGNHDSVNEKMKTQFVSVSWMKRVRHEDVRFVLSHYPLRTWAGQGKNTYNLHGHCHGNLEPLDDALDVGCMLWSYAPLSVEEVLTAVTVNKGE